jgi:hypothetical protein
VRSACDGGSVLLAPGELNLGTFTVQCQYGNDKVDRQWPSSLNSEIRFEGNLKYALLVRPSNHSQYPRKLI